MNPYLPLLMLFGFAAIIGGVLLGLSHLMGKGKLTPEKGLSYECGLDAIGNSRQRFSVKFYLVAMLFILFDIEVVFLYPWAVMYREFVRGGAGLFIFGEMLVFLAILVVGLVYVYGRRALEWDH